MSDNPERRRRHRAFHLEVGEVVGRGGASEVCRATELASGRTVALKRAIRPQDADAIAAQFDQLAGFVHPNVVTPHALTTLDDGQIAMLMELVDGPQLAQRLPLPLPHRLSVGLGVMRGLAALHAWGVVHGDISPDNVMLEPTGDGPRPRLIDAGAHVAAASEGFGTPGYIAPEVLRGAAPSAAADVYGAGCVLVELLDGKPLFEDIPAGLRTQHHLTSTPQLSCDLPEELRELLGAMLGKHPDTRPSAAEVLERMAELAREEADPGRATAHALVTRRCDAGLASIEAALEPLLDALGRDDGELRVIRGGVGDGGDYVARRLSLEAVRRGYRAMHIGPAGGHSLMDALSRACGLRVTASRDLVMSVARALAGAAEQRPLLVVLDARAAAEHDSQRVWETLSTASGAAPVSILCLADADSVLGSAAERLDIPAPDARVRAELVAACLGEDMSGASMLLGALGQGASSGALWQTLHGAVTCGAVGWRGGRWRFDRQRLHEMSRPARGGASTAALVAAGWRPDDLAVLAALAMAGGDLERLDLATVVGIDHAALDLVVRGLEAAALVERPRAGATIRATNRRRALAVAARLDPAHRQQLHLRLAALPYPQLEFTERLLQQQHHLVLSGALPSVNDSIALLRELVHHRRHQDARDLLDYLEARPDWTEVERRRIALARAETLIGAGELEAARALLSHVTPRDPETIAGHGELLVAAGDAKAALEHLAKANQTPRIRLALAGAHLWAGDNTAAERVAKGLVEEPNMPPSVVAGACNVASTCAWQLGRAQEAETLALTGLEYCGRDRRARADLLRALGIARFYGGDIEAAREVLAEATTENRALGRVPAVAKCLNNLAMCDYARGRWVRAASTWEEFRLFCARVGEPVELANACNNLGYLHMHLGRHAYAARLFERCLRVAARAGYGRVMSTARSNLGEALMRAGDLDGAEAAYDDAEREMTARGTMASERAELRRRRLELMLRRGRLEEVAQALAEALEDPLFSTVACELAHLHRLRADALRGGGRLDEAHVHATQAVERFVAESLQYETAAAREGLAGILCEQGRTVEAANEARMALDSYLSLGAQRDADRAAELHRSMLRTTTSAQSGREEQGGRALLEVALRLSSTLEVEALIPLVLDRVVQIVDAERGLFALYDDQQQLQYAVTHNLEWRGLGTPLPVSRGVLSQAMELGRVVVVQDVETSGEIGGRLSVRLLGLRSIVAVPVKVRERPVGVIYVDSRTEALRDLQRDIDLLGGFAALVGVCVENARLFAQQRFRAELLGTMAHDFRAPLSVVQANIEMMSRGTCGPEDDEEILEEVAASTVRMTRMIDNTLELSRMEHQQDTEPQRVEIVDAITAHLARLRTLAAQYEVALRVVSEAGVGVVHTFTDRLWIAVDNLVFNAMKFAREGTDIEVALTPRDDPGPAPQQAPVSSELDALFCHARQLEATPSAGFVEVAVTNRGRPVPKSLLPRIFGAYARGDAERRGVKSTGLGLSIAARVVAQLGGRIWVEAGDEVTCFRFTLPVAVQETPGVARPSVTAPMPPLVFAHPKAR